MDVGVIIGDVPVALDPREHLELLLRQVAAAQAAGVKYLTIGQHFLYEGHRWLQPVPTLARLAAEVSADTRLVTTVLLLPLQHPVVVAEELATLDVVTAGRLVVGLGLGYRTKEFENLGVPFGERARRFEEALEVMTRLWTEPQVEFHGQFFTVEGHRHIQPWQQPRPPLWIGADGPAGVRRAARLADGWPIGPNLALDRMLELQGVFVAERERCGLAVGRQPIRRDVSFGRDRAAALSTFVERTSDRFRSYAANERQNFDTSSPAAIEAAVAERLIHGTVAQCVEQVADLAGRVPIDPLIVRAHWPAMTEQDLAEYFSQLRDFAAALAEL